MPVNFSLDDFNDIGGDDSYIHRQHRTIAELQEEEKERYQKKRIQDLLSKFLQQNSLTFEEKKELRELDPNSFNVQIQVDNSNIRQLVESAIELWGPECKLNWIDVGGVTDFRGLFIHSPFNGNISGWDIPDDADCSYMFAFSEFKKLDNLPKKRRDELVNSKGNIDTTGIFLHCQIA